MKGTNYSLSFYWDNRAVDPVTKESRIFLTVNMRSGQFRVSLKLRSTKPDFEKALASSTRSMTASVLNLKKELDQYFSQALAIFLRNAAIDKTLFLRLFKSTTDLSSSAKTDVFTFFDLKLDELLTEKRIGTYRYYHGCKQNLLNYRSKICFEDIDVNWLKGYQRHLQANGNSTATVALRLRALKVIYNFAVAKGFIAPSPLLFKSVATGSSVRSKAALYPDQLKALWDYQPIGIRERKAKATFFFLYLANGMNQKDMSVLKWSSIKKDSFSFVREKTKHTRGDGQQITVHLNDVLKGIIEEWGTKDKSGYVFPILKGKDFIAQEKARDRHKRICNKMLAKIGKELGFEVHLCLNLARHSFATAHMLLNTPLKFISDSMGHSSSAMTEHYMKSLPVQQRAEISNKLLSFV